MCWPLGHKHFSGLPAMLVCDSRLPPVVRGNVLQVQETTWLVQCGWCWRDTGECSRRLPERSMTAARHHWCFQERKCQAPVSRSGMKGEGREWRRLTSLPAGGQMERREGSRLTYSKDWTASQGRSSRLKKSSVRKAVRPSAMKWERISLLGTSSL